VPVTTVTAARERNQRRVFCWAKNVDEKVDETLVILNLG
jgi:hypothetical protein